ncbi:swa family protein [Megaselia abdita]
MISEESFPSDRDPFHLHVNHSGHHTSICDRSSSSLLVHEENNSSGQSSSGISSRDKSSDDSKETSGGGSSQNSNSKKSPKIESSISTSYQDIHSAYTKKRYQHVKSKVAEYIASIKEQDRLSRKKRKMQRHRSLPETLGLGSYNQIGSPAVDAVKPENCDSCGDLFKIKESEVEELKNLNEYLQTNLEHKVQQSFMLRRDAEKMQFELMQLKEKERSNSLARQNSVSSFSWLMDPPQKITINSGTQTEEHPQTPERNVAMIFPTLLGFQKEPINEWSPHLRQRSNSSSVTPRKPDIVEESMDVEDSNNNLIVYNLSSEDESKVDFSTTEVRKRKKTRGLKHFKTKLAWVFGSCTSCNHSAGHESALEEYSYTQLPLIERSNVL